MSVLLSDELETCPLLHPPLRSCSEVERDRETATCSYHDASMEGDCQAHGRAPKSEICSNCGRCQDCFESDERELAEAEFWNDEAGVVIPKSIKSLRVTDVGR